MLFGLGAASVGIASRSSALSIARFDLSSSKDLGLIVLESCRDLRRLAARAMAASPPADATGAAI
jgi:hypothetical protein